MYQFKIPTRKIGDSSNARFEDPHCSHYSDDNGWVPRNGGNLAPLGSFMQAMLAIISLVSWSVFFQVFEGMSRPGFPLSWFGYWIPKFKERSQGGSSFVLSLLIYMSIIRPLSTGTRSANEIVILCMPSKLSART